MFLKTSEALEVLLAQQLLKTKGWLKGSNTAITSMTFGISSTLMLQQQACLLFFITCAGEHLMGHDLIYQQESCNKQINSSVIRYNFTEANFIHYYLISQLHRINSFQ